MGYQIPFVTEPPTSPIPVEFPSYLGNQEKFLALEEAVLEMLRKRAIEEVSEVKEGFYNRLFLVKKATGEWRPVLDVSRLNVFVQKTKFSMETTQSVLASIQRNDWMVTMDMRDAYFHVPIHQESRPFLRFVFNSKVYQFRALCFGLTTAPQVFTRVLAPLAKIAHLAGIRIILYLDDWLILANSLEEVLRAKEFILTLARELGIMINKEKSQLKPKQTITYLGIQINSVTFWASPAQRRIVNCLKLLEKFLSSEELPARSWQSLLGHMSSIEKFIPGARLRMRPLQYYLRQRWDKKTQSNKILVTIPQNLLSELQWWNNRDLLEKGISLAERNPDLFLLSDASLKGWGATVEGHQFAGTWSKEEAALHINNLELRAVWYALKAAEPLVRNKSVAVLTDNKTALAYIAKQGGTKSWVLFCLVREILLWTEERRITLMPQFISGTENVVADSLSRKGQVLPTEWTLNKQVCHQLWRLWGQPLIDLFATRLNHRLPLYMSPHIDPQALAVDAMLHPWCNLDVYAFPPFAMVRQVINKVRKSTNCKMTLVAPWWPQREWFPDLVSLLVDKPRRLPLRQDLLTQPLGRALHPNLHSLQLVGWRLSSDSLERKSFHLRSQEPSVQPEGHKLIHSTNKDGLCSIIGAREINIPHLVPL